MSWTEEKTALVKKLWESGNSAAEIGRRVGKTRNAVLGKIHRIGLAQRTANVRKKHAVSYRVTRPKPTQKSSIWASLEAAPVATAAGPTVSFNDLEPRHCRFIPGDPIGVKSHQPLYCGQTIHPGLSYCPTHAKLCLTPAKPIIRAEPEKPTRSERPVFARGRSLQTV